MAFAHSQDSECRVFYEWLISTSSWDNRSTVQHLLSDFLGMDAICTIPGPRDTADYLFAGLMVASAHLWDSQWPQWLTATPRVPIGEIMLPRSTHRESSFFGGLACLLMRSRIITPCLFVGLRTLLAHPQLPQLSGFRLFPHSQFRSSPWVWSLKSELQHPGPICTDRAVSQAGKHRAMVLTCAGYSLFAFHKPIATLSS